MARLTAASAAAWLALGAAPMARAARARGGLRAAFLTGSEPAIGPGAGAPVVAWEQARAAGGAACTSPQELGPLAPDTSVHCVPRPREASFDAGKDVLLGA